MRLRLRRGCSTDDDGVENISEEWLRGGEGQDKEKSSRKHMNKTHFGSVITGNKEEKLRGQLVAPTMMGVTFTCL